MLTAIFFFKTLVLVANLCLTPCRIAQSNVILGQTVTTWACTRANTVPLANTLAQNRDKQVVAFLHESQSWAEVESFLVWAIPPC